MKHSVHNKKSYTLNNRLKVCTDVTFYCYLLYDTKNLKKE